jgi:hypothetical protein
MIVKALAAAGKRLTAATATIANATLFRILSSLQK